MGVKFLYKGKEFEIHLPSEVFRHDNQEKIDFGSFFSWALDNPLKDDIEVIMPMLELAAKMEREIIFLRQP